MRKRRKQRMKKRLSHPDKFSFTRGSLRVDFKIRKKLLGKRTKKGKE